MEHIFSGTTLIFLKLIYFFSHYHSEEIAPRIAENLWKQFRNYHLTEKVRSAEDKEFSSLCDRVGYNNLTSKDIEYLKSRDIPCPYEDDPENFKLGKVILAHA